MWLADQKAGPLANKIFFRIWPGLVIEGDSFRAIYCGAVLGETQTRFRRKRIGSLEEENPQF